MVLVLGMLQKSYRIVAEKQFGVVDMFFEALISLLMVPCEQLDQVGTVTINVDRYQAPNSALLKCHLQDQHEG